jgi:hypothetical protein
MTRSKITAAAVAALTVVGLGVSLAPSSSAAPANKKFSEVVSIDGGAAASTPQSITAGTHTFRFTITNTSTGPTAYFGSWQVTVPTGFTDVFVSEYVAPTNFSDPTYDATTRTITGNSTGPNGSGVPTGGLVRFTVTATAPTTGICPSTWNTQVKQANDFSSQTGNDFVGNSVATPVAGSSRLAWGVQPTDMQYDTTPTPAPTVLVVDACGAPVTTSATITITSSNGTLASGASPVTATGGTATLSGLKFTDWEFDTRLTASSAGLASATSDEFHVYQFRKVCPTDGSTCTSPTLTGPNKKTYVNLVADAGTNPDILTVSVWGDASGYTCNDTTTEPGIGEFVTIDVDNRAKRITMRLPKQYVLLDPNNGTPFMDICLDTTENGTTFVDKSGNTVSIGLIPDCTVTGGVAPCIVSRGKKAGDEYITYILPPGDPKQAFM